MISDKLKIRISPFVGRVIENDAQAFGFIKADNTSNKNALLNRVISQMLKFRQEKREQAAKVLTTIDKSNVDSFLRMTNKLYDDVYYSEEELSDLSDEIWIRPSKETVNDFEEIARNELISFGCDVSVYIRGMLNEYSRMSQYKRQNIVFREELLKMRHAIESGTVMSFRYDGAYCKVYAYDYSYGYLPDQSNYLIAYDIEREVIRAFELSKLDCPKNFYKKFKPSVRLRDKLRDFVDTYDFNDAYSIPFKEAL